jgi:hypothetical protein
VGARVPGGAPAEVGRRRSRARVVEDEAPCGRYRARRSATVLHPTQHPRGSNADPVAPRPAPRRLRVERLSNSVRRDRRLRHSRGDPLRTCGGCRRYSGHVSMVAVGGGSASPVGTKKHRASCHMMNWRNGPIATGVACVDPAQARLSGVSLDVADPVALSILGAQQWCRPSRRESCTSTGTYQRR